VVNGRLIAPEEVRLELARGADDLHDWAVQREAMFRVPTDDVQLVVTQIVDKFPGFVPDSSQDGVWADPYVIALAKVTDAAVVTGEKPKGPTARIRKIPNVCADLGIRCMNLTELLRAEHWNF
jgi:hypothetical protein